MKDALLRVIDAALTAKALDEKMAAMGYGKTPYADIYGKLEEALFLISGEDLDRFEGSTAQMVLENKYLKMERRAEILDYARKANCGGQERPEENVTMTAGAEPKPPQFLWGTAMDSQVKKNGGYSAQTGYVPPVETDDTPEGEWR